MDLKLLEEVEQIVSPVYMVGGSVRDLIREVASNDYDFATPLLPDDIEAAIKASGRKAYVVGKRFGTVGFKLDGKMIEVTTFRHEKYEPGSRKPAVEFTDDLVADLSRRDFTINAMALSQSGLVDPYYGSLDLKYGVITAVGDPKERIAEDPLRMLRAFRFQSQLGFTLDDRLFTEICYMYPRVLTVSKERWVQELDKLLVGPNFWDAMGGLCESGLMSLMIPEYHGLYSVQTKEMLESSPDVNERWLRLLSCVGMYSLSEPYNTLFRKDTIRKIAFHLKFSKERINYLLEHC